MRGRGGKRFCSTYLEYSKLLHNIMHYMWRGKLVRIAFYAKYDAVILFMHAILCYYCIIYCLIFYYAWYIVNRWVVLGSELVYTALMLSISGGFFQICWRVLASFRWNKIYDFKDQYCPNLESVVWYGCVLKDRVDNRGGLCFDRSKSPTRIRGWAFLDIRTLIYWD